MSLTITKYEQIWVDGLNRGDVSGADEAFAENCIIHMAGAPDPNLSVSEFKELLSGLLTAFPDLHISVNDQMVSGDKVATRWTAIGTHTGPLGDSPPSGNKAKFEGLILDRVVEGQVVERWEQWDQMGMLQQIGLA
ncbi:ester cyclase [Photobacterium frigidiphilum]|uniref:Ester cyclase n=1 Tax=Photobacterium frigidiphilum TaxID=264736 RepID=A0A2T3JNA0_9GAMM|nr:ester cyclase [Photobacterium frigidiphilum]PSU50508.1 ester cyclase [Photobacterium frigidiphilum]